MKIPIRLEPVDQDVAVFLACHETKNHRFRAPTDSNHRRRMTAEQGAAKYFPDLRHLRETVLNFRVSLGKCLLGHFRRRMRS